MKTETIELHLNLNKLSLIKDKISRKARNTEGLSFIAKKCLEQNGNKRVNFDIYESKIFFDVITDIWSDICSIEDELDEIITSVKNTIQGE